MNPLDPTSEIRRVALELLFVLLLALGCAAVGAYLWDHLTQPSPSNSVEKAEVAIQQAPTAATPNGSTVLQRAATDTKARAVAPIPKGATLVRQIGVDVQPAGQITQAEVGKDYAPVHIDLSETRMPDGSHRVVASSPNGPVTGGLDIPAEPLPRARPWAAGIAYGPIPGMNSAGIWAERDLGRVRIGVEYDRLTSARGVRNVAQVRVGWTW